VIDIASRRVVGFTQGEQLRTELVAGALINAVAAGDPAPGVVFHADRGRQDTSGDYAALADDLTAACPAAAPASPGTTRSPNRSSRP
jgi:transposase InsO family protein